MPVVHEGNLHLYAVPSIANLAVPTMAEINAGVDLTPALTADRFSPTNTENTVSTDMLTGFIKQSIGTEGIGFDLTFLREAANGGDAAMRGLPGRVRPSEVGRVGRERAREVHRQERRAGRGRFFVPSH